MASCISRSSCVTSLGWLYRLQRWASLDILESLDNSGRPPDFDQLRNRIAARAGSQPLVTGGEIADGRVDGEILSQPRRGNNFNATAYVVAVRFRADGLYSQPISAVPTVISQDVSFDPRC